MITTRVANENIERRPQTELKFYNQNHTGEASTESDVTILCTVEIIVKHKN